MSTLAHKVDQFEAAIKSSLATAVTHVVEAITNRLLSAKQLTDLSTALKTSYPGFFELQEGELDDPEYGADFDLTSEINQQIRLVRAMRSKVLGENGHLKNEIPVREARETITSSNAMIQQLMKHHKDVMNMERMRAVETATIEAVKTLPDEQQAEFFGRLESLLAEAGS